MLDSLLLSYSILFNPVIVDTTEIELGFDIPQYKEKVVKKVKIVPDLWKDFNYILKDEKEWWHNYKLVINF